MNKNLLAGLPALIVGAILSVVLPAFGINIDLALLMDGAITLGDILMVVGTILVNVAEPSVNEMRKTTVGRAALGAPKIERNTQVGGGRYA